MILKNIVTTVIEKCVTKSYWHGFTERHFEILYSQQIIFLFYFYINCLLSGIAGEHK